MLRGTDIPVAIDESRGCKGSLANTVDMEQVELAAAAQDKRLAFVIGEKDLAVHNDGRRREPFALRSAKPILPECSPRLRIERSGNACHIVDHVQLIAVENRGWNKR